MATWILVCDDSRNVWVWFISTYSGRAESRLVRFFVRWIDVQSDDAVVSEQQNEILLLAGIETRQPMAQLSAILIRSQKPLFFVLMSKVGTTINSPYNVWGS
jgi:hypothetical protein